MIVYFIGLLNKSGLVSLLILFFLQYAGYLLGFMSLGDELIIFFIVLLCLL